jgi:hypothetical protein
MTMSTGEENRTRTGELARAFTPGRIVALLLTAVTVAGLGLPAIRA